MQLSYNVHLEKSYQNLNIHMDWYQLLLAGNKVSIYTDIKTLLSMCNWRSIYHKIIIGPRTKTTAVKKEKAVKAGNTAGSEDGATWRRTYEHS